MKLEKLIVAGSLLSLLWGCGSDESAKGPDLCRNTIEENLGREVVLNDLPDGLYQFEQSSTYSEAKFADKVISAMVEIRENSDSADITCVKGDNDAYYYTKLNDIPKAFLIDEGRSLNISGYDFTIYKSSEIDSPTYHASFVEDRYTSYFAANENSVESFLQGGEGGIAGSGAKEGLDTFLNLFDSYRIFKLSKDHFNIVISHMSGSDYVQTSVNLNRFPKSHATKLYAEI